MNTFRLKYKHLLAVGAGNGTGSQNALKGAVKELGAAMIFHSIGEGLLAYPSLLRQDSNYSVFIDGKIYRWDLTIESDGTELPVGVYRAQVKPYADVPREHDYHPELAIIPMGRYFRKDTGIFEIRQILAATGYHNQWRLRAMQDDLLELLDTTGPVTDELLYLRSAA